ncbi:MAG: DUF188 domain-containing protein, partial [Bacilli bacterium]
MRIIIDADACPNINEIIALGQKYHKETIIYADDSHIINQINATVIIVSAGSQNVDIKLLNDVIVNDVVITQDYGVAVIALGKKCHVINQNGIIYTNQNIDLMMEIRHLNQKSRKQNKHVKGPKKRTNEIKQQFLKNLE